MTIDELGKKRWRPMGVTLLALLSGGPHLSAAVDAPPPPILRVHKPLESGRLEQWVLEEDGDREVDAQGAETWELSDGVLSCDGGRFGFLRFNQPLADFKVRLEVRIDPETNSGIGFRAETYRGSRPTRPSATGYELQLLGERAAKAQPACNNLSLYGHADPSNNVRLADGHWHELALECRGPRIRVTIDGKEIHDVRQHEIDTMREKPSSGFLSLQSHTGQAEFRSIEVVEYESSNVSAPPQRQPSRVGCQPAKGTRENHLPPSPSCRRLGHRWVAVPRR